jgi:hypothetical protein
MITAYQETIHGRCGGVPTAVAAKQVPAAAAANHARRSWIGRRAAQLPGEWRDKARCVCVPLATALDLGQNPAGIHGAWT